MCTVIIAVPRMSGAPTRVLAVRDEDPGRPWDPPGEWWPTEHPGVRGVRDRRENGAWLAASSDAGRLAVILNRPEPVAPDPTVGRLASRGRLVLDSVSGTALPEPPGTAAFNLVEIAGSRTLVTRWDGIGVRRETLAPGVHMIAHHDVDDPRTPRITRWLPEFEAASRTAEGDPTAPLRDWRERWLALLSRSASLGPGDDRAIIRDNRAHGFPTLSLLVCLAEIGPEGVSLVSATLAEPGRWREPEFGSG